MGCPSHLKVRLQGDPALLDELRVVLEEGDDALAGQVKFVDNGEPRSQSLVEIVELAVPTPRPPTSHVPPFLFPENMRACRS